MPRLTEFPDPIDPGASENIILARINLTRLLGTLPDDHRVLLELQYAIRAPHDYTGWWPPTLADIGRYLGATFQQYGGKPVPERTLRRLHARLITLLRRVRA